APAAAEPQRESAPTPVSASIPASAPAAVPAPAADARPAHASAAMPAAAGTAVQASPGASPRLLLVEDNPVNMLVAQKLLAVLGYTCDTAPNGEVALAHMIDNAYDLVLMDCQMPVLDGYAATRRWREHEAANASGRRPPIIATTAYAIARYRLRCLGSCTDDYVS